MKIILSAEEIKEAIVAWINDTTEFDADVETVKFEFVKVNDQPNALISAQVEVTQ